MQQPLPSILPTPGISPDVTPREGLVSSPDAGMLPCAMTIRHPLTFCEKENATQPVVLWHAAQHFIASVPAACDCTVAEAVAGHSMMFFSVVALQLT